MAKRALGMMLATLAFGASAVGKTADSELGEDEAEIGKARVAPQLGAGSPNLEAPADLLQIQDSQNQGAQIQGSWGVDTLAGQDGGEGQAGADGAAALRVPVGTAFVPSLIASSDTCMGSHGFGAQVASVGVAVGRTWQDENCVRIKNARQLNALGYRRAAVALLCIDDEVREAMRVAGTPCPGEDLVSFAPEPQAEPAPPPEWPRYAALFDFDSARLKPEADSVLQEMLATLQADASANVDIVGHTDWVGTDAYNLGLSQRRAQSVVDWLIAHGVARERLNAVGMGESEPIASNEAALGRAQNRRVEIRRRG